MKRLTYFIMLALLAFGAAACGGGAASGPAPVSFTVDGLDTFHYEPESLTVATGAEVTIEFENKGSLDHSWVLISNRVDPLQATQEDAFAGGTSGLVAPGESKSFTFVAPAPGAYKIVCTVPAHAQGGMIGTLTVTQ